MQLEGRAALEVIGRRRSVRVFRPYLEIPEDKLVLILEAGRRASHFGNLSSVGAVVLQRRDQAIEFLSSPTGAIALQTAPTILVWTIDYSKFEDLEERQHELVAHGAFGVSKEVASRRISRMLMPLMHRRKAQIIESGLFELDAGQAIAQVTIAANAMGIASCLCGVSVTAPLREALRIPENVKVAIAQALGYALESTNVPPRPRRPFRELFHRGHFGGEMTVDRVVQEMVDDVYGAESPPGAWRNEELKFLESALGQAGRKL